MIDSSSPDLSPCLFFLHFHLKDYLNLYFLFYFTFLVCMTLNAALCSVAPPIIVTHQIIILNFPLGFRDDKHLSGSHDKIAELTVQVIQKIFCGLLMPKSLEFDERCRKCVRFLLLLQSGLNSCNVRPLGKQIPNMLQGFHITFPFTLINIAYITLNALPICWIAPI